MKLASVRRSIVAAAVIAVGALPLASSAQPFNDPSAPTYTKWQAKWDLRAFRDPHVIVGEVIDFRPYRVEIRRSTGETQRVDLKHGTRIAPLGATPTPGERVAIVGYYSRGTFIVNRLVIR
ncbi:MAG: hypothetical protein IAI50_12415 [Candidatus Eremiobacteraeota bacterium]|nr:hypothetical protein [Candidatus Eremiobacteraeota bacterium]